MIVKNEEDVLARCLNSISSFVDEIIIVDTGSTDKTKEIAKTFTDKIFDFKWIDDFSLARNFSISKATKDYIMWLDADDVIEKEELKKLLSLKPRIDGKVDMYRLKYNIAFDKNDNPTFSFYRERIFKNNKTYFWQDPVHEVIVPHGVIENLDIAINHRKIHQNPPERNLKIYQKLLDNKIPFSARQKFYYSRELMYNGMYKEAIQSFDEFLVRNDAWLENKIEACLNQATCYEKISDKEKALRALFNSFNFALPRAEILCSIGNILVKMNRLIEAVFWYKEATKCKPNYLSGAFVQKEYYDIIPYLQLCMCYYNLGDIKKSKYYNNLAFKIDPKNPSVIYNLEFFKKKKS